MGTKNNPAPYDCYANAEPDEPIFVLLGRDLMAAMTVEYWANLREQRVAHQEAPQSDLKQIEEARENAVQMRRWRRKHRGEPSSATGITPRIILGRQTNLVIPVDDLLEIGAIFERGKDEIAQLRDAAIQLLADNNREIERRRAAEGGLQRILELIGHEEMTDELFSKRARAIAREILDQAKA